MEVEEVTTLALIRLPYSARGHLSNADSVYFWMLLCTASFLAGNKAYFYHIADRLAESQSQKGRCDCLC